MTSDVQYEVDPVPHWRWVTSAGEAVFTTRLGGVSGGQFCALNLGSHVGDSFEQVSSNRAIAAQLVDLTADQVAGSQQVHGADVWLPLPNASGVPLEVSWSNHNADQLLQADALVTDSPIIGAAVAVADCAPIAISCGRVMAVVHAGWRGIVAGVIDSTMATVSRRAGSAAAIAGEMQAVVGPAIGKCCFEVGSEVIDQFSEREILRPSVHVQQQSINLSRAAAAVLQSFGTAVTVIDVCTSCDSRMFSYRGDGAHTGRQAVIVRPKVSP